MEWSGGERGARLGRVSGSAAAWQGSCHCTATRAGMNGAKGAERGDARPGEHVPGCAPGGGRGRRQGVA